MFKKCVFIAIVALLAQAGLQAAWDPNTDPDLLGYWTFEEGAGTVAADLSGNGNDGTLTNGPVWVTGRFGGGLHFDGDDDYVDTGSTEDLARWTICCWVMGDAAPSSASPTGPVHREQNYQINWDHSDAGYRNGVALSVGGSWYAASLGPLEGQEWYHLAGTYDGENLRAYTNGALITTNSGPSGDPSAETNSLKFARHGAAAQYCAITLDEVRVYRRALTDAEIKSLVPPKLKAYKPSPADGTVGVTMPLMSWSKGDTALFHDIYFGTSPDLTEADRVVERGFGLMYWHVPGLVPGTTYYWRVDEIDSAGNVYTGDVWSFMSEPLKAYAPTPADGAEGVFPAVALSWLPGKETIEHQVYFSSNLADVTDGTAAADQGVVEETTLNLGVLRSSTTYYWRVEETKLDQSVEQGEVWSFTTADGVANKILYEVWEDISGDNLSALTGHADYPDNPTTSEYVDSFESPVDWADNYGQRFMGWLKPPQTGDYTFWIAGDNEQQLWLSTDGSPANAVEIANVPGWTPALDWDNTGGGTGDADAQESDPIALQAGQKYFIMALGKEGTGGDSTAVAWQGPGIDTREVIKGEYVDMYALAPLVAFSPYPADGAVDTPQDLILQWNAGEKAQQHEVYFGDDADAVAAADTSSPLFMGRQSGTTFGTGPLEWGKTYSWRIDEINAGDPESPWVGRVWSFTTANFVPVDDFEGYTDDMDAGETIWQTWIDGLTNLTGSIVGYFDPPFAEQTIVHGGNQSMPFDFNNIVSPYYSELELPLDPTQDWTVEGVTDLSLWIRGYPAVEQTDVTVTGGAMTLTGAGEDIWNNSDQFTYAYKTLNGDGSMVARVTSIGPGTNTWAKGGVMIRDSLDGGSTHAMMIMSANTDGNAGNGASFQYRLTTDGASAAGDSVVTVAPPYYVKIERSGNGLTGYMSIDGNSWSMVGSTQFITMSTPVYIGICVTSHEADEERTFEFDNIQATGAVSGAWQGAVISAPRHNTAQNLYVVVEDSSGNSAMATDPDLVNSDDWTEWTIPLSSLGGVNLSRVGRLYIGVGDHDNPTPDGAGLIFVDDIRVTKPAAE